MSNDSSLTTELNGPVAIIRFNRPAERNPLSTATLNALRTSFSNVIALENTEAVIFTGADDVFASGADIRELTTLDSSSAREFAKTGQQFFQTIASTEQVTIAAINGYCMGGALDLALACDIRLASTNAVFAHPGARLGLLPVGVGRSDCQGSLVRPALSSSSQQHDAFKRGSS